MQHCKHHFCSAALSAHLLDSKGAVNKSHTLAAIQVGSHTANFDVMVGNPLAKQIPWDTNPTYLAAWKEGKTGQALARHSRHPLITYKTLIHIMEFITQT